ncbi:hypothetical protein R1flu_018891 [Riccia fluitans]|uniref:Uncharacterized protein n=1 Tax=Riccia fluitans TaxID=41844 RepID=A0ABD1ZHA7_9MARC
MSTSIYLEVMIENNRKNETRLSLNCCRRLSCTDDSDEDAVCPSNSTDYSRDEERNSSTDGNRIGAQEVEIGGLEVELEHLGFV